MFKEEKFPFILGIFLGIILVMFVVFVVRSDKESYEISDLAFDVCRKNCFNKGGNRGKCSRENMQNCIDKMVKLVGVPPDWTSFSNSEKNQEKSK